MRGSTGRGTEPISRSTEAGEARIDPYANPCYRFEYARSESAFSRRHALPRGGRSLKDDPGHTGLTRHPAPTSGRPQALDLAPHGAKTVKSFALFGATTKKALT